MYTMLTLLILLVFIVTAVTKVKESFWKKTTTNDTDKEI